MLRPSSGEALKEASASDRNVGKIPNSKGWYLENHPLVSCPNQVRNLHFLCTPGSCRHIPPIKWMSQARRARVHVWSHFGQHLQFQPVLYAHCTLCYVVILLWPKPAECCWLHSPTRHACVWLAATEGKWEGYTSGMWKCNKCVFMGLVSIWMQLWNPPEVQWILDNCNLYSWHGKCSHTNLYSTYAVVMHW